MLLVNSHFEETGATHESRPMHVRPHSLDDLQAAVWVQAFNDAWLSRKWPILEKLLAGDVTLVSTEMTQAIVGRTDALDYLRAAMARARIHEFNATDLKGYTSGSVGIITHRWQLDWTVDGERRSRSGRDILVLEPAAGEWQLAWRGQMVRRRPGADLAYGWRGDWC